MPRPASANRQMCSGWPAKLCAHLVFYYSTNLGPVGIEWAPEGVSDEQRDQMQSFAQRAAAGE